MDRDIFWAGSGRKNNEIHRLDRLILATDGVFIVDRDKRITNFSEKVERVTGYSFQEIAGKGCRDIFDTDLCQKGCPVDDTLVTGNVYTNICVTIKKKDKSTGMISTTITALKDIKGMIVGAIVTFKDMAEIDYFLRELERKSHEVHMERSRFYSLVEHLSEGIFSVDRFWRITSFNRTAEQLTGYSREEVAGRECRSVFSSNHCNSDCILEKALYLGDTLSGIHAEIQDSEGRRKSVLVTSIPLYDQRGEFAGGVETLKERLVEVPTVASLSELTGSEPELSSIEAFERQLIVHHLEACHWNRSLAAKKLGISPVTLWRKMKKYGIHR